MTLHSLDIVPPFINVPSELTYSVTWDQNLAVGHYILIAVNKVHTMSLGAISGTCSINGVTAPNCYVESLSSAHWVIYMENT